MDIRNKDLENYRKLEQRLLNLEDKRVITLSTRSLNDFSRYYELNQENILKLNAEIICDDTIPGSFSVVFTTREWDATQGAQGWIYFPKTVAYESGIKIQDRNRVTLFLEPKEDEIRAYLSRQHIRELSHRRYREIRNEIAQELADISENDY